MIHIYFHYISTCSLSTTLISCWITHDITPFSSFRSLNDFWDHLEQDRLQQILFWDVLTIHGADHSHEASSPSTEGNVLEPRVLFAESNILVGIHQCSAHQWQNYPLTITFLFSIHSQRFWEHMKCAVDILAFVLMLKILYRCWIEILVLLQSLKFPQSFQIRQKWGPWYSFYSQWVS